MLIISPKHKVYLAVEPIDFRKGINGIRTLCQNQIRLNPLSGHYFVFRNKSKKSIKVFYYDSRACCLHQQILSDGVFDFWPKSDSKIIRLTPAQMQVLMQNGNPELNVEGEKWRNIADEN